MSYTCTLYTNTSNPNVLNKSIATLGSFSCDFKNTIDVETPEVYVAAGATYDKANYMYIPEFGRYYFCKARAGVGNTITFECKSDPLMSFKAGLLSSKAVIARNPWHFNLYIPDSKLPIESRNITSTLKFPNTELFGGSNNCYILTTLGPGSSPVNP